MSLRQRDLLQQSLAQEFNEEIVVSLGMRYGNPSMARALEELRAKNVQRLLVLPLYPQYSSTTTASNFDAIVDTLKTWRWLPELRLVMQYHDEPKYIAALEESVRELWNREGKAEKLLMSFHGIPRRYFDNGDPYYCHCQKTGRLLAERLGLGKESYLISFQSLFGKEEWLKPYTIDTLSAWGAEKLGSVDVLCPGFTGDCLETLEEIDQLNREAFTHSGGGRFRYIPALNDRPTFIAALKEIAVKNLGCWVTPVSTTRAAGAR